MIEKAEKSGGKKLEGNQIWKKNQKESRQSKKKDNESNRTRWEKEEGRINRMKRWVRSGDANIASIVTRVRK